jgi:hypothetical protein
MFANEATLNRVADVGSLVSYQARPASSTVKSLSLSGIRFGVALRCTALHAPISARLDLALIADAYTWKYSYAVEYCHPPALKACSLAHR